MRTFKNKNSLRTIEAQRQIVPKLKNNEARPKFTGSYKRKKACRVTGKSRRNVGFYFHIQNRHAWLESIIDYKQSLSVPQNQLRKHKNRAAK